MGTFNSNQKIGEIVAKFPNASDILKNIKLISAVAVTGR